MSSHALRYSDFWDRINVDAFEEAIGWTPEYERDGNDVGFCVFPENHSHGDTTGKFAIHREKRLYNCYVCGGGSLLSLVMELRDLDQDDATEWLYQFTDEDMRSDEEFVDEFLSAFADIERRVETLPYFNERVLEQFADPIPDEWLAQRMILPEVARQYGVRYGASVRRPAPKRGKFSEDDDYHGPAIIFPHYWKGRLVGWQARWMDEGRPEWVPKYTMTGDFPKDSTIYGWDHALYHSSDGTGVIVVESVPSALFLASCGHVAVATFGSNVNDAQMRLLRRLQSIVLAPDHDTAGEKWRDSLTEYLKRYCYVWHLPPVGEEAGADIGDLASEEDPFAAVEDLLRQRYEPGIDL